MGICLARDAEAEKLARLNLRRLQRISSIWGLLPAQPGFKLIEVHDGTRRIVGAEVTVTNDKGEPEKIWVPY